MARKRYNPEEIVSLLRQAEVCTTEASRSLHLSGGYNKMGTSIYLAKSRGL